MVEQLSSDRLFAKESLFAQGIRAAELTFLAQDARGADGALIAAIGAEEQARRTLENLRTALSTVGQGLEDLVSLTVFLVDYQDARGVALALEDVFAREQKAYPATTFLGVMGLEGGCRVRIDAVATSNRRREQITLPEVPLALGSRCHVVRVDDLVFLAGVDAADAQGKVPQPTNIEIQTVEVLNRLESILRTQGLSLAHIFRTFMYIPGTEHRPGYGKARRRRYQDIFREDEFPANSGIYIKELGEHILLRSVAVAYQGRDRNLITSPKVWLAPGSFSQAFRVGEWLFVAGQDAIGLDLKAEAVGDLAGQTEVSLRHIQDILEAAGGSLDDVVKTTVYLVAGQERATFASAYEEFFRARRRKPAMPAGLTVEVRELAPSCLVEIDAVALLVG